MGIIPWSPLAGGWLTGRYRKGQDVPESRRSALVPDRYDMSNPANQAKLDAADALAELAADAGISLIEMSLAFVLEHPAVTAPIIGPRTMEQLESQLPAAEIRLSPDVLDRIDEIVPPGTTVNPTDDGWTPPAIADPRLRRRSLRGSNGLRPVDAQFPLDDAELVDEPAIIPGGRGEAVRAVEAGRPAVNHVDDHQLPAHRSPRWTRGARHRRPAERGPRRERGYGPGSWCDRGPRGGPAPTAGRSRRR